MSLCQCQERLSNGCLSLVIKRCTDNTDTLTHKNSGSIYTSGARKTAPAPLDYYFLFFSGFLTPRLTRYTEAAKIAPSAKLASGVPMTANKIDISLPFLHFCSGCAHIFHQAQHSQRNHKSQQRPLHLTHLDLSIKCAGLHVQPFHSLYRRNTSLPPLPDNPVELRVFDGLSALVNSGGLCHRDSLPLTL